MRSLALALSCGLATLGAVTPAGAFSTASAISVPCHEQLTLRAFEAADTTLPIADINLPDEATWSRAADVVFEAIGDVDAETEEERFFFFSLFIGVRAPDTEGFSGTNVQELRGIHANEEGQYDHCLRAIKDDGPEGDANAHRECIAVIEDQLERARNDLQYEPGGRVIRVPFTLDHYGTFEVSVWGPAYHIGRALHAIQDSFTHTVRSDDLRTIYGFGNYIEAIDGSLQEERDGLAHSSYADRCGEESNEVANATFEASADILRATATFLDGSGDGDAAVATALATWMSFQPGCGLDADFCGSKWEERARRDPTGAYLGCAVAAPGAARTDDRSVWTLGLMAAALAARRLRRGRLPGGRLPGG